MDRARVALLLAVALATVPAVPAAGPDMGDSRGAFCCLASRDEDDFCGSCPAYARADPSSHCGESESSCAACGANATWCTEAVPAEKAADSVQGQLPSLQAPTQAAEAADSLAPTAAPTPPAAPSAAPTPAPAPRAAGDGFCCLASTGTGADFCGQCFPGGRALPGSRCGGSRSDCQFCGGQATWCEEAAVQPAADSDDGEDGQCCLAAMDSDDFCGSCLPNAIANSSSRCGGSRAACEDCGGGSRWCGSQPKGARAATLVLRGLEGPAKDAAEAVPFDCNAGRAKWESGWSDTKKSWCCEAKGSPCPETTTAAAETTTAAAETASLAPEEAPKPSNGTEPAAAGGFCCFAAEGSGGHFCGTCFPSARAQGGSQCGKSQDACEQCGGAARWCDALSGSDALGGDAEEAEDGGAGSTGAASKTSTSGAPKPSTTSAASKSSTTAPTPEPTAEPTAAPTPAPTRPAGFCCLAAPNPFDYCGSCPGFAMASEGSGCAASEFHCNQCGGLSKWCEIEDSTTPEPLHLEHSTTSHAPKNSKQATARLGVKEVVAEVVGKPSGGDSGSELQRKFGGGAFLAAAEQLRRRRLLPDLATLLCLPGLVVVAFASLACLWRMRCVAAESDADPPLSAQPMVQADDSELDLA